MPFFPEAVWGNISDGNDLSEALGRIADANFTADAVAEKFMADRTKPPFKRDNAKPAVDVLMVPGLASSRNKPVDLAVGTTDFKLSETYSQGREHLGPLAEQFLATAQGLTKPERDALEALDKLGYQGTAKAIAEYRNKLASVAKTDVLGKDLLRIIRYSTDAEVQKKITTGLDAQSLEKAVGGSVAGQITERWTRIAEQVRGRQELAQ